MLVQVGSAKHVAIGTDLDGGVGKYEIPEEIVTAADLSKFAEALLALDSIMDIPAALARPREPDRVPV